MRPGPHFNSPWLENIAPVYQEFNQLPVVTSTQDTGVVTPQSSVAPVTPVAPAATESSSVTPTVPSE